MLTRLSAHCLALPCDPRTDRPSLGCVHGARRTLLVDGGNSPDHLALMLREMARTGLPAPDVAAVTHAHWDHVFGLCALSAPVIACEQTQEQLARMSAWAWTLPAMEARLRTGEDILFCHENMLKEYPDPGKICVRTADVVFDDCLTLDLGGCEVRLLRLENSHAAGCVVVYVPGDKVIFLGDILYEDLHHTPPCYHRARFEALRRALDALDFDTAVPGHQPPLTRSELARDLDAALTDGETLILP